ncbi:MAG: tetratricopeptide repeat protein [Chloroflexota bacterium]|nr:tetratricopeptide repeat protein [Chloroflexota bacterium]
MTALSLCVVLVALVGCAAGVNEDLAATATPRVSLPTGSPPARLHLHPRDQVLAMLTSERPEFELRRLSERIATAPDDAESRALQGVVQLRLGNLAEASKDVESALATDPGAVAGYVGRGLVAVAIAQGRTSVYTAALEDFNRALTLDGSATSARLGRALALVERARHSGDVESWTRALASAQDKRLSEEPLAAALIAVALANLGDDAGARQTLERARETLPSSDESVRKATLLTAEADLEQRVGRLETALERTRVALQADPWQWEARRIEAAVLLALKRPQEAHEAATTILASWPDDGRMLLVRAGASLALGRREEAIADVTRAQEVVGAAPAYSAAILQVSQQLGVSASPVATPPGTAATGRAPVDPYHRPHALKKVR